MIENTVDNSIQITPIKVQGKSTHSIQPHGAEGPAPLSASLESATPPPTIPANQETGQQQPEPSNENKEAIKQRLLDIRDDQKEAVDLVRQYIKNGGSIQELQTQFASNAETADSTSPFSPEVNEAIQTEQERQQFLEENKALFINIGQDGELVKQKLEEYCVQFHTSPEDLFEQLSESLSEDRKKQLETFIVEIENKRRGEKIDTIKKIALDLGKGSSQEALNIINKHPRLFTELGLAPNSKELQMLIDELNSFTDLSENTIEQNVKNSNFTGTDFAFLMVWIMTDTLTGGRGLQELIQKILHEKVAPNIMRRFGIDEKFIEKFSKLGKGQEIFNLPTNSFINLVEDMNRYDLLDFLSNLDQNTRQTLLDGSNRDQKLDQNTRERLFLKKLKPNDLKNLGVTIP